MKIYLLFIALSALLFSSCSEEIVEEKTIRPVKIFQIDNLSGGTSEDYPAISKETKKATLAFRVAGPLIQLNVEEGQIIEKGKLIAEIDPRDFLNRLAASKAEFKQSEAEVQRFRKLYAKNSIAINELDKYEASYELAKANYIAAQNALEDTRMLAPFSGAVESKMVNNFERVNVDEPIISLLDFSSIDIKLYISVNLAVQNKSFGSYEVEFDAHPGKKFSAVFKEIGKKAEGGKGVPLTLTLHLDEETRANYPIGAGMACNVKIIYKEDLNAAIDKPISIPLSAVFAIDGSDQQAVWIYDPATSLVKMRPIEIEKLTLEKSVAVKKNLKPGDMVVTVGVSKLQEGQVVKLMSEIK